MLACAALLSVDLIIRNPLQCNERHCRYSFDFVRENVSSGWMNSSHMIYDYFGRFLYRNLISLSQSRFNYVIA